MDNKLHTHLLHQGVSSSTDTDEAGEGSVSIQGGDGAEDHVPVAAQRRLRVAVQRGEQPRRDESDAAGGDDGSDCDGEHIAGGHDADAERGEEDVLLERDGAQRGPVDEVSRAQI